MKHEFFAFMGTSYPSSLEREFERILIKIEDLWDTPKIHDYFGGPEIFNFPLSAADSAGRLVRR